MQNFLLIALENSNFNNQLSRGIHVVKNSRTYLVGSESLALSGTIRYYLLTWHTGLYLSQKQNFDFGLYPEDISQVISLFFQITLTIYLLNTWNYALPHIMWWFSFVWCGYWALYLNQNKSFNFGRFFTSYIVVFSNNSDYIPPEYLKLCSTPHNVVILVRLV